MVGEEDKGGNGRGDKDQRDDDDSDRGRGSMEGSVWLSQGGVMKGMELELEFENVFCL